MPDLDGMLGSEFEVEDEGVETPPVEEQPKPLTQADLDRALAAQQGVFQQQLSQFTEQAFNAIAAARGAGQQIAPTEEDEALTEEELVEAGFDAKTARKLARQGQENRVLKGQINRLETTGLEAIAELTDELMAGKMPYYKDYKDEIEHTLAEAARANPAIKVNAKARKFIYDQVIGSHMDEIVAKKMEEAARAKAAGTQTAVPTGTNGRQVRGGTPTQAQLSQHAEDELSYKGVDRDQFARRLGYEGWADYMKKTSDL